MENLGGLISLAIVVIVIVVIVVIVIVVMVIVVVVVIVVMVIALVVVVTVMTMPRSPHPRACLLLLIFGRRLRCSLNQPGSAARLPGIESQLFLVDADAGLTVNKLQQLLPGHRKAPALGQTAAFLI